MQQLSVCENKKNARSVHPGVLLRDVNVSTVLQAVFEGYEVGGTRRVLVYHFLTAVYLQSSFLIFHELLFDAISQIPMTGVV